MKPFYAPGAQDISREQGPRGMLIAPNGARSIPAGAHWLYCNGDDDGEADGGYGVMCMTISGGGPGLHITLTPDGLRQFAQQCVTMAADLEATAARQAADFIARAQGAAR